jgi:hypothetical protein
MEHKNIKIDFWFWSAVLSGIPGILTDATVLWAL